MLTLCIRYLTGNAVATDTADRSRPEWPPHPGRVFMALAAAHFQTGDEPAERAALEWLESQPPPQIHAPPHTERAVVTHFVPVNDKAGPAKAPLQSASGLTRERQPRTFARAWLEHDTVYLIWPDSQPNAHFAGLSELCDKVTRIGHSSSLVQMWASHAVPPKLANWTPDERRATARLRVPGAGSLSYLERQFNRDSTNEFFELTEQAANAPDPKARRGAKQAIKERFQNAPPIRLRPELSLSHGYAPAEVPQASSLNQTVFDSRLVTLGLRRADGPYRYLDLKATLQLTARVRESVLKNLGPDASEALTGHRGERRAEIPHIAYLPLPFVGHEHAHGGILGIALALPRELSAPDRQQLLQALSKIRADGGIRLGPLGRWEMTSNDAGTPPVTLRDRLWTAYPGGARQWATVTPYVCDRHAKAKDRSGYQKEVAESVQLSWQRIRTAGGTDCPPQVIVTPVSAHLGTPPAHAFPRLKRKDGSECGHTHAILVFEEPVVGPLLLGAGRYRGYGMCRPLTATEGT